ncbi:MAG TPA: AMP-binding protein [Kofleriaceae bacterium]|nr:AMP-binding protein [Kofleriaceae bacterium]
MTGPATLVDQLARAASRAPDRVAVALGAEALTYAQLWQRAGEIAGLLARRGVARGDLVGVCLPKSPEAIAAWFGALRAGAAYAPLDPASPLPRLEAIARQARFGALIADPARPELGGAAAGAPVVWDLREPGDPPPAGASGAGDLAYVYFTSGSTGTPKGVAISQRAALAALEAAEPILGGSAGDVVANHAPLVFDLASFDVHFAVRCACAVQLVPDGYALMPGSLLGWLEAVRPTLLYTVPSTLKRLASLSSIAQRRFPSLRGLIFAGERPDVAALRALRPVFPDATFHHWYGSTEAALVTAVAFPPGAELPDPMPMGRAVRGVELALDGGDGAQDALRPGAQAELWVAGDVLLDGYRHDAERTAEAFAPASSAARWFRTRDVVRCDADGELHFVSRLDRMVKVKGLRVDLGEVEAALEAVAGVRDAAVIALADPLSGARLIGFAAGEALEEAAVRDALRGLVPAHMVPDRVEVRARLPRTVTGKLDRAALERELSAAARR